LAKRYGGSSEEELSNEEKGAMLKYALQDLAQELYIELLAGFYKYRGSESKRGLSLGWMTQPWVFTFRP
jgi:hypothetical protein